MKHISEKYAEALFGAAQSLDCVQTVSEELQSMDELLRQCGICLNNPKIGVGDKSALLKELLSSQISALTLEFIILMVRRRHLRHLPAAARRFRQMSDRCFGRVTVDLRIPFEPEQETLELFKSRFLSEGLIPEKSAEKAEFKIILDKDIIGGFIAYCNGYQIDASLKTSLAKLYR